MNIHERFKYIATHTLEAVYENQYNWKLKEAPEKTRENRLHFLGTGGNPYNLASQYKQTGGICMFLDGELLLVDPGPASVYHAVRNGIDVRGIDGIYVSHGHTDHYLDMGSAIEAMTHIMSKRRGRVMLPAEMVELGMLSTYHQGKAAVQAGYIGGPAEIITLTAHQPFSFSEGTITPIPAHHGGPNFGFIYDSPSIRLGYTSDTNYIQSYERHDGTEVPISWQPIEEFKQVKAFRRDLKEAYSKVDILIANVSYFHIFGPRHITGVGLAHLLQDSSVKTCIITHLDPACYHPVDVTADIVTYIEEVSGVRTILAQDNAEYRVEELIK